jgi:hypothetical protein
LQLQLANMTPTEKFEMEYIKKKRDDEMPDDDEEDDEDDDDELDAGPEFEIDEEEELVRRRLGALVDPRTLCAITLNPLNVRSCCLYHSLYQ